MLVKVILPLKIAIRILINDSYNAVFAMSDKNIIKLNLL